MKTPSSSAENSTEWESYVGKAVLRFGDVELVSIRLIAANGDKSETEMYVEHSIRSVRSDEEFLDLPVLKEFADEVENLSAEIWFHYCKVVGSSSDLMPPNETEHGLQ